MTNPLMLAYDFHKKAFKVRMNPFLELFEELFNGSSFSIFEGSVNLSGEVLHAGRFRLGSAGQNVNRAFEDICGFLDLLSKHGNVLLEREVLEKIVGKGPGVSGVSALGIGIDTRERVSDSKTKCYFMVDAKDEIVDLVLSLHPKVEQIEDYLVDDTFLFAVEMHFDGRSDVEIYPRFKQQNPGNSTLVEKLNFGVQVQCLIEECRALTVSFESGGGRVLHFHPVHPTRFIRSFSNRALSLIYSNVQALDIGLTRFKGAAPVEVSLAFQEKEVTEKEIRNISLYYRVKFPFWKDP